MTLRRQSKMKKRIYFLLLAGLLALAGCSSTATDAKVKGDPRVTVMTVNKTSFSGNEVIGKTEEEVSVAITPKIPGELISLSVKKGNTVKQGQVLGKVDDRDLNRAVELQQKARAQALSQLEAAKVNRQKAVSSLANSKAQLEQAKLQLQQAQTKQSNGVESTNYTLDNLKVRYEDAKRNLERMTTLYESGTISEQQYEAAQNAATQAQNAYEQGKVTLTDIQATESIDMLKKGVEQAQIGINVAQDSIRQADVAIKQAQTNVNLIQTQIQQAKDKLSDTVITAPQAGEVIAVDGDVGEMVSNQKPLFTLISIDPIKVNIAVEPDQLALFEVGKIVSAKISDIDLNTKAKITFITPVADADGLYNVEALINNPDKQIKPGMEARLAFGADAGGFVVPVSVVENDKENTFVYVVENGKVVKKSVQVVKKQGSEMAITGINKGNQLVVKGQSQVKDGQAVKVVNESK